MRISDWSSDVCSSDLYLISEQMISNAEVITSAAQAAEMPPPTKTIPLPVAYAMATAGSVKAKLRGTDERLSLNSMRLMRADAPVDCSNARRELRPADRRVGNEGVRTCRHRRSR